MDPAQTPAPVVDPANPAPATPPAATVPEGDDKDWASAITDFENDKGVQPPKAPEKKPEDKKDEGDDDKGDEQTPEEKKAAEDKAAADKKAEEDAEARKKAEEAEAEKVKTETPEQTEARHKSAKEAADKKAAEQADAAPASREVRDLRSLNRIAAEDSKTMEADVRKEMFSDIPTELLDSDGDPIRTIDDVQKLINPNTKKLFTEEEAGAWLLAAQQHLNKKIAETDAKVRDISDVNLSLKDQADNVREKWGDLLKAMPQLAKSLHAEYQNTLVKDEKSDIIIKAPVSLERFYDTALAGYAKTAELLEKQAEADNKDKKDEKKQTRKDEKEDRGDVVPRGKSNTQSPEDEEWEKAHKAVYEG